jgi:hypothetical protein
MHQLAHPCEEYILNFCTKHLSRAAPAPVPDDEASVANFRAQVPEAWRFPIIGYLQEAQAGAPGNGAPEADHNLVTFVYKTRPNDDTPVEVLGTFATLYKTIPLEKITFLGEDTGYRALSLAIPKGELHTYKFLVGNRFVNDPINPQQTTRSDGRVWSRFFTDEYLQPIILEPWELRLLYRLVEQILPFRTAEGQNFLNRYYFSRDQQGRLIRDEQSFIGAFRLDGSVGEVNAIDKLLAREEAHRLNDYHICLKQIVNALRAINPYSDPYDLPAQNYIDLYNAMAASKKGDHSVRGWDYSAYDDPAFFIYLLRRHAVTTAFSHPKYAGNVGAAGWAFLSERFVDKETKETLFDWRAALEKPLGMSEYYC